MSFLPQFQDLLFAALRHGRHYHLDLQVDPKIAKRHFFQDIQNSFQWATGKPCSYKTFLLDTLFGAGYAAAVHFDRCCLLGQYGHTQTA